MSQSNVIPLHNTVANVAVRIPGSIEWSEMIRENCKTAAQSIESTSYQLGGWLEQIYEQADTEGNVVWKGWGYPSFEAYVETELRLGHRTAERMRKIYRVVKALGEGDNAITYDIQERLLALGSSRLNHLVRLISKTDVLLWLEFASRGDISVRELEAKVVFELDRRERDRRAKAQEQGGGTDDLPPLPLPGSTLDENGEALYDGFDGVGEKHPPFQERNTGGYPEGASDNDVAQPGHRVGADALPKEKLITRNIKYDEQTLNLVNQAIATAKKVTGARGDGYALGLICLSYLGTVDYDRKGVTAEAARATFLRQIERSMNIRLVAIDPKTSTLTYGSTSLQLLANKLPQIEAALEQHALDAFAPADNPADLTDDDRRAVEAFAPLPEGEEL